jgi:transcriptional regulator with XRE-family HTH domain
MSVSNGTTRKAYHHLRNGKQSRKNPTPGRNIMILGDRLREIRESKGFSQGFIEERTGLLRCYVSRVENNHTIPSIDTLEKWARAMEVPLYQIFNDGENVRALVIPGKNGKRHLSAKEQRQVLKIGNLFTQIKRQRDRELVAMMMRKLAR